MTPIKTIRRAILDGRFPEDIASIIQHSLRIFLVAPVLYDRPDLRGPAKRAELVVKLGYWLAQGQLTEQEFRLWVECIPPENNTGWDVDLLYSEHGSRIRPVLKIGPLFASPEAGLIHEARAERPLGEG